MFLSLNSVFLLAGKVAMVKMVVQIQRRGQVRTPMPWKIASSRSKGFLRNTGTDPLHEAIGPLWSNCFSREVRKALVKNRGETRQDTSDRIPKVSESGH